MKSRDRVLFQEMQERRQKLQERWEELAVQHGQAVKDWTSRRAQLEDRQVKMMTTCNSTDRVAANVCSVWNYLSLALIVDCFPLTPMSSSDTHRVSTYVSLVSYYCCLATCDLLLATVYADRREEIRRKQRDRFTLI